MSQPIKDLELSLEAACKADTIIKKLKQAISLTAEIQLELAIKDHVPPNTGFRKTLNKVQF